MQPAILPVIAYVLLCISYAYSSPQSAASAAAADPLLRMEKTTTGISVAGDISSAANEAILRQTGARYADGLAQNFDLHYNSLTPPGWALLTEMTLRAAATTVSSSVEITATSMHVRGVTEDLRAWHEAFARVREHLLPNMSLADEVIELDLSITHEERCLALFQAATEGRTVRFSQAGTAINSSAFSLLDEIVQISADCPQTTIAITGHTDASGDEGANMALSKARADAVAHYLAVRGISPDRVTATGRGSAQPLATGNNARARVQNRRIEFEFR